MGGSHGWHEQKFSFAWQFAGGFSRLLLDFFLIADFLGEKRNLDSQQYSTSLFSHDGLYQVHKSFKLHALAALPQRQTVHLHKRSLWFDWIILIRLNIVLSKYLTFSWSADSHNADILRLWCYTTTIVVIKTSLRDSSFLPQFKAEERFVIDKKPICDDFTKWKKLVRMLKL